MENNMVKEMINKGKELKTPSKEIIYKTIDKVLTDKFVYKFLESRIKIAISEGVKSAILFSNYIEIREAIRINLIDDGYKISANEIEESLKLFCDEKGISFGIEPHPFTHEVKARFYVKWDD